MQLPLPFAAAPAVVVVRHRRARRYIIRVLHDGTVRVTVPRGGARREALAFVERSRSWIEQQHRAREQEASRDRRWRHGSSVLVNGEPVCLDIRVVHGNAVVSLGEECVSPAAAPACEDVRAMAERWLRARARRELPPALEALAARHGVTVSGISVRNQRSRWGACSPRGAITLNWRLIQVPPFVREYVMLHELMHRRELNHSRRFWRHVAAVCPQYREARRWLLTRGAELF